MTPEKSLQWRKILTVAFIAISDLCVASCLSLMAPFYPIEAEEKGTSDSLIGVILASSDFMVFLISPFMGYMSSRIKTKTLYIGGLCVFGLCDVLYGFLDRLDGRVEFITLSLVIRIVEAIGIAAVFTSSYSLGGQTFPQKSGTVFGVIETAIGAGFFCGPAIGGGLFNLGGFGLPFWVMGGLTCILGCAAFITQPPNEPMRAHTDPSKLRLLKSVQIWFAGSCISIVMLSYSSCFPVYAKQLKEMFGLNEGVIGLAFAARPLPYSLSGPLWGFLYDKKVPVLPSMLTAMIIFFIALLLFGPAPFLIFLPSSLWLSVVSNVILGLCGAPIIIGAMQVALKAASEQGFDDMAVVFGLVSGFMQSAFSFGFDNDVRQFHCMIKSLVATDATLLAVVLVAAERSFLGPLLGGVITDYLGFAWTMTIISFTILLPMLFLPCMLCQTSSKKDYMVLKGSVSSIDEGSLLQTQKTPD